MSEQGMEIEHWDQGLDLGELQYCVDCLRANEQLPIKQRFFNPIAADSLIIMFWVADFRDGKLHNLKWANKSLRSFYKNAKGEELKEIPFREFLASLSSEKEDVLEKFIMATEQAPKLLKRSLESNYKEAPTEVQPESVDAQIEIFRLNHRIMGQDNTVLGARVQSIAGIRFEVDRGAPQWYDLYSTLQFKRPKAGAELTSSDIVGVQGVFIPVGTRNNIANQLKSLLIQSIGAGVVARSTSHNLGSHAIFQIAADLSNEKDFDDFTTWGDNDLELSLTKKRLEVEIIELQLKKNACKNFLKTKEFMRDIAIKAREYQQKFAPITKRSELKDFLNYLSRRSELSAMLASGLPPKFSVTVDFQKVVDEFNEQTLLRSKLCTTEDLHCNEVKVHSTLDQIDVSVIGGDMGYHAIYALFENFARNSARHSFERKQRSVKGNIMLTTLVEETRMSDVYKIRLFDSGSPPVQEDIVAELNDHIGNFTKVLKLDSPSTNYSIGMLEMLLWTSFLRGHGLERAIEDGPMKYIEYGLGDDDRLQLIFYLPKGRLIQQLENPHEGANNADFSYFFSEQKESIIKPLYGRGLEIIEDEALRTPFGRTPTSRETMNGLQSNAENRMAHAHQRVLLDHLLKLNQIDILHIFLLDNNLFEAAKKRAGAEEDGLCVSRQYGNIHCHIAPEGISGIGEGTWKNFKGYNHSKTRIAIWERHGRFLDRLENDNEDTSKIIHYECYSIGSNQTANKHQMRDNGYDQLFSSCFHEEHGISNIMIGFLAEAALSKVLIVDERLAKIYEGNSGLMSQTQRAGIYLLNPWRYPEAWPNLVDFPNHHFENPAFGHHTTMPFAFKAIHVSLKSDKKHFPKSDGVTESDAWNEFVSRQQMNTPFVSYHSGKGGSAHHDAPVALFSVSTIRANAFEAPCKFNIVQEFIKGGRSYYDGNCI